MSHEENECFDEESHVSRTQHIGRRVHMPSEVDSSSEMEKQNSILRSELNFNCFRMYKKRDTSVPKEEVNLSINVCTTHV